MDFSSKLGIVLCTYLGISGYNFQNIYCNLKIFFTSSNSVDPDEMLHLLMRYFIGVFTVCKIGPV